MKRCGSCKIDRPLSDFYMLKGKPRSYCRECNKAYQRDHASRQRKNPEFMSRVKNRLEREWAKQGSYRVVRMFNSIKYSARRRKVPFALLKSDLSSALDHQQWKCAKTGIPFDLTVGDGRKPFGPAVDRIKNEIGYLPGNIQIVCNIYNFAKMDFSDADVLRMAEALTNANT